MKFILICLLAALLAVATGEVLGRWPALPGWLIRIIEYAVLLIAFAWLQTIF